MIQSSNCSCVLFLQLLSSRSLADNCWRYLLTVGVDVIDVAVDVAVALVAVDVKRHATGGNVNDNARLHDSDHSRIQLAKV